MLRRRLDAMEEHHDKPDYDSDGGVSPPPGIVPPDDMPVEGGEERDRDDGSDGGGYDCDDADAELVTDLAERAMDLGIVARDHDSDRRERSPPRGSRGPHSRRGDRNSD